MVARDLRLSSPLEFERTRSQSQSWACPLVVAVVLPTNRDTNRYGFAVGRRVGNAVVRNRAKRLMRETVRNLHPMLDQGFDVVFIARNRFGLQTRQVEIDDAIATVLERAGLLGIDRPVGTDPRVNHASGDGR